MSRTLLIALTLLALQALDAQAQPPPSAASAASAAAPGTAPATVAPDAAPAAEAAPTPPPASGARSAASSAAPSASGARAANAADGSKAAAGGPGAKGTDRLELGTTEISGNRELPKVLYVVPWRRAEIGDAVGRPPNSLVEEALTPVDRDVFRRQNRYYSALQAGAAPAKSQPAAAGGSAPHAAP